MDAAQSAPRHKYYDLMLGGFITVILCSNLIGPGKTVRLTLPFGLPLTFGAGNLFFPVSYIFDDVLTEVYGYARARRAIWCGFAAMVFATVMGTLVLRLPADPREPFNTTLQPAFTPLTYVVVNALERAEREDFYDVGTNFTPFSLE